ncbi:hypothetical protein OUZ56_012374 [Daphnia magna]|uniref:Uncharacterized protein n=1 Tax=Daphnia magna TaxID=35525 RepID=A0ABQ9Z2U5_9CRUS|nr:hypothetical protein OUZ56_012374 [Daphnia magna]
MLEFCQHLSVDAKEHSVKKYGLATNRSRISVVILQQQLEIVPMSDV